MKTTIVDNLAKMAAENADVFTILSHSYPETIEKFIHAGNDIMKIVRKIVSESQNELGGLETDSEKWQVFQKFEMKIFELFYFIFLTIKNFQLRLNVTRRGTSRSPCQNYMTFGKFNDVT